MKHVNSYVHIYDDVRSFLEILSPSSLYPLNKAIVRVVGRMKPLILDLYGEPESIKTVELRIDDQDWVSIPAKEIWEYKLDTTNLVPGRHTIMVRMFNGTAYSRSLAHPILLGDSDFYSDIQSLEKAAVWINNNAWDAEGKFKNYYAPSNPYEYVHVSLGPYVIGCLKLYNLTDAKTYMEYAITGLKRLLNKQLSNGGIMDDRRIREESLDSAWASYCYSLATEFPGIVANPSVYIARDKAISRLKALVNALYIKNWYPYFVKDNEIPNGSIQRLKSSLAQQHPIIYDKIKNIWHRTKSIDPILNYQARAIWALAKYFDVTKNEVYWTTAIKALDEYVKFVNSDGSIPYCNSNPSLYLYYMSWETEAILESMIIAKANKKDVLKYEQAINVTVRYLLKHTIDVTSNSKRFHFELNCKPSRGQGRGQGTATWIMTIISTLSLYNKYFGHELYDVKPFINYAKTLQNLDGSFPIDEWDTAEKSLWATCCYLHSGAIAQECLFGAAVS